MKIECSLCDSEFDVDDSLIFERTQRHEDKHTRGWNYKGQSSGGGNNTTGHVDWITKE